MLYYIAALEAITGVTRRSPGEVLDFVGTPAQPHGRRERSRTAAPISMLRAGDHSGARTLKEKGKEGLATAAAGHDACL